jgi:sulfite reductase alpha subunit-like flavoprotein
LDTGRSYAVVIFNDLVMLNREHGSRVAQLILKDGAYFFVAGNSKEMPTAVRAALTACLAAELEGGEAAAASYVDTMETSGRYQTETWA